MAGKNGDTLAEKIKAMMNQIERSHKEGTANLVEARKVLEMIAGDLVGNSYMNDLLNEAKTILEMYEAAAKENEKLGMLLDASSQKAQEQDAAYKTLQDEYNRVKDANGLLQNRADVLETTIKQYLDFELAMQKAGINDIGLVTRYIQGDPRAKNVLFGLIKFKEDSAQSEGDKIVDVTDLGEVIEEMVDGENPLDEELTFVEEEKKGAVMGDDAGKVSYNVAGAVNAANPGPLVTAISSATAKNKKEEGSLALLSPEATTAYKRLEEIYNPKSGFGEMRTKHIEYGLKDALFYMVLKAAQIARPEMEKSQISAITSVEVSEALATDIMTFLRDPAKSRYFSEFAQRINNQAIKEYINGVVQDDCSASSPGAKIKLELMIKPIYEAIQCFLEDHEKEPGILTSKMPGHFGVFAKSLNDQKGAPQKTTKTPYAK